MKQVTIMAACVAVFVGAGMLASQPADASVSPCRLGKPTLAGCQPSGIRSIPAQPSPAQS